MPSAPKVPKQPSPDQLASAQIDVNRQGALDFATLTNVGQQTPYGSMNIDILGYDQNGLPIRNVRTELSPAQQALLNILQGTQGVAGQAGQNLLTAANYGGVPDLSNNAGSRVQNNLRLMSEQWNPTFTQQSEQLDNQLRNQGIMPGTQAYDRAMRTLQQNQHQTISTYLATAQPTAFNQAVQEYQLPFEMSKNLSTLGQPANLPGSLVKPPDNQQFQPPNLQGIQSAINQGNQFAYQASLAQQQALLSGITSMGAAALPFLMSDEDVKSHIKAVGKTFDGQTIYRYRYKGDDSKTTHIGLIAQEVEKKTPKAVKEVGGIKHVDYKKATDNSVRASLRQAINQHNGKRKANAA